MKILSVIIPIYKVESYLERCIRSIENQDISRKEYEVICINDGSPDNSKDIIVKMQEEYDNIILIDQDNQGVSRARNNGMRVSTGKYLLFVDPDDYLIESTLGRLLNKAENSNVQILFTGFKIVDNFGKVDKQYIYQESLDRLVKGINAYYLSRDDGRTDPDRMWGVFFRRNFLLENRLFFLPDVPYLEDGELIARILCLAQRCLFDDGILYTRTMRIGSATNSKLIHSKQALRGFIKAALNLKSFGKASELNHEQKLFINQPIAKFVLLPLFSTGYMKRFKTYLRVNHCLRHYGFKRLNVQIQNKYYKRLAILYNTSIFLLLAHMIAKRHKDRIKNLVGKGLSGNFYL